MITPTQLTAIFIIAAIVLILLNLEIVALFSLYGALGLLFSDENET